MQSSTQWTIDATQPSNSDPLLDCLVLLCQHFGNPCSGEALVAGLPLTGNELTPELVPQVAARGGLSTRLVRKGLDELPAMLLPCILVLKNKKACVLQELNVEKGEATISLPETGGEELLSIAALTSEFSGYVFLVKQQYRGDRNFDVHIGDSNQHWLWQHLKAAAPIYRDVIIASIMVNIFSLVSPLFVMNIYDKVVPNLAFESLWVLATGASIVFVFDFVLKQLRGYLIDVAGKKVDITVSSKLFSQVITMPLEKRAPSVGGMAKQLAEFDHVREFLSSATITALVDLPFAVLFMLCIYLVAGDLALFPLVSSLFIIGYTALCQPKLRRAIEQSNKFSGLRHGHLVECLNALEAIKANGGEGVVQNAWQQMIGHTSSWLLKSKTVTNSVSNFAGFMMQLSVVGVVVLGVYRVADNDISMGGIIAAVMLASRAIAPVAKLANLMTRSNQTISALRQLDDLMAQQGEFEDKAHLPGRSKLSGNISAENISFSYPGSNSASLHAMSINIKQGEKIALVGQNGSGKTTLAKLLLGLLQPTTGSIQFDGYQPSGKFIPVT